MPEHVEGKSWMTKVSRSSSVLSNRWCPHVPSDFCRRISVVENRTSCQLRIIGAVMAYLGMRNRSGPRTRSALTAYL